MTRPSGPASPGPGPGSRPGPEATRAGEPNRFAAAVTALSRVTAGPLLVRAVAFGAGFALLQLAVPLPLWSGRLAFAAVLLAGAAAVFPGSGWVMALESLAVAVWFGTTTVYRYDIPPAHLLALAVALYVHHSWCALAAVMPVDVAVSPRVLRDWLLRTAGVLAVALPLGLLLLALPEALGRSRQVYLPVLGLAALLAAGYGLVRLARSTR